MSQSGHGYVGDDESMSSEPHSPRSVGAADVPVPGSGAAAEAAAEEPLSETGDSEHVSDGAPGPREMRELRRMPPQQILRELRRTQCPECERKCVGGPPGLLVNPRHAMDPTSGLCWNCTLIEQIQWNYTHTPYSDEEEEAIHVHLRALVLFQDAIQRARAYPIRVTDRVSD